MELCHSTPWENFQSIIKSGYIIPQRLEDRELCNLSSIGVKGIWLTNKPNYSDNYFGPYGAWFDTSDIAPDYVADCGLINGAATYIVIAPILAAAIGIKMVLLAGICPDAGFNIIVTTPLPVSGARKINVFSSFRDRIGRHRDLGEAGWHAAAAKLMAYILLQKDNRIISLIGQQDIEKYAKELFWRLVGGNYDERREEYKANIGTVENSDLFMGALDLLSNDLDGARICTACLESKETLADIICESLEQLQKIVKKEHVMTE